ncbi:XdhC family protein [Psychrobacter immobilis]|uniref:XdhC family protein n=1 Tax=Psychrobacter immobilis TaxID=498 RepID=UPI0019189477|nr:XdhC/CoxI family protein [Psychrobacter immobilis]
MNQIADILKLASAAQQQNVDAVLATVVRTEGSAYRRAGAMMLICEDGRSVGMISGGCLEPHIIKRAFWLTRHGANVQVYQTGDDIDYTENGKAKKSTQGNEKHHAELLDVDFYDDHYAAFDSETYDELDSETYDELDELNFGLGCNGRVHVLFERLATAKSLLEVITQVRRTQQPITMATLIRSNGSQPQSSKLTVGMRLNLEVADASNALIDTVNKLAKHKLSDSNADYVIIKNDHNNMTTEWLVQRLQPQIRLLICGAGNDVMPLVTMAKLQDWHVTVIDSRSQYATRMRFPQADEVVALTLDDTETLLRLSHNAAVALMSHSLSQDRARLAVLLEHPKNYRYIGQLGPRYRTERLINEISATIADPKTLTEGIGKLHYPIGYKLGGDGPEALALGIMAQINAVMHQQTLSAEYSDANFSNISTIRGDAKLNMA